MNKYLLALATATLLFTSLGFCDINHPIIKKIIPVFENRKSTKKKKKNIINKECKLLSSSLSSSPMQHYQNATFLMLEIDLQREIDLSQDNKEKETLKKILIFLQKMPEYKKQKKSGKITVSVETCNNKSKIYNIRYSSNAAKKQVISPEERAAKEVEKTVELFKNSSTSNDAKLNAIMEVSRLLILTGQTNSTTTLYPTLITRHVFVNNYKNTPLKAAELVSIKSIIKFIENMDLYKKELQLFHLRGYKLKM